MMVTSISFSQLQQQRKLLYVSIGAPKFLFVFIMAETRKQSMGNIWVVNSPTTSPLDAAVQ
jgi:hypothetical protein